MNLLGSRSYRFGVLVLLLVACFVVVLPALRGDLLHYDDRDLLLGPEGALERSATSFFTAPYYYAYLPFYGLSYWIEGRLVGGEAAASPWIFHLGNLLWHAAASYLVFCVLGILLRHRTGALFGALLFALHPLHVESVSWIAGRKELVSGFFFFLAWLLHLRGERGGMVFGPLAWAMFLVACFAKASAVILPMMLLASAALLPRYRERRRVAILATLPFFVVAIVPVVVHLAVGVEKGVIREVSGLGERSLSGLAAWGSTIQRTLVPLGLSIDYPEARLEGFGAALLPLAWLGGAIVALVVATRRFPVAGFGILAFFAALLPFNSVFPATDILAADRYAYLALFGWAVLVAMVVSRWRSGAVAAGIVAVAYAVLAVIGSSRFVSDEALWTRTIASRDASALAWINRGQSRTERALRSTPQDMKLLDDAIVDLEAGLIRAKLSEHRAKASQGLVLPLLLRERPRDALERAADALAEVEVLDSADAQRFRAQVLYHRGLVFRAAGNLEQAAADFVSSAEQWGRYPACFEAGCDLMRVGRLPEARRMLERAARLDPANPDPYLYLGKLEEAVGNRDAHRRMLDHASERAPNNVRVIEAWVAFWLRGRTADYRKAAELLKQLPAGSAERRRLEAEVESERALFHFRRGELIAAITSADLARAQGISEPRALYELGQIYLDAGRYPDAVACFRAATDALSTRQAYRDAVARALTLQAHSDLRRGEKDRALQAMRSALEAKPRVIDAGGVPLRGELERLRGARNEEVLLLAAAAIAGDAQLARNLAQPLLASEDQALVRLMRGSVNGLVLHDFDAAEEDLRPLVADHPEDLWVAFRLAQVLTAKGVGWMQTAAIIESEKRREQGKRDIEEAITILSGVLDQDPEFHPARLQRGEARFALDDLIGAKADYQYVRDRDADAKEVLLKEAALNRLVYVRGGKEANLLSAIGLLRRSLELDPNYFGALFELGNVWHLRYDSHSGSPGDRRHAFNQALVWYRRAMALNPRAREPRVEWARICMKAAREGVGAGSLQAAHDLLERVESEASDVAIVHKERARLNLHPEFTKQTGVDPTLRFEGVEKALAKLEELSPDDPELPELRSLFHRTRGYSFYWTWVKERLPRRKERARQLAVEAWAAALDAWPADPENVSVRARLGEIAPQVMAERYHRRGVAAYGARRFQDAVEAFGEALALFPEATELRLNYAQALARIRRVDDALLEFERIANGPDGEDFPQAMYEAGNICLVRRERATALVWYERFLASVEKKGEAAGPLVERARAMVAELK